MKSENPEYLHQVMQLSGIVDVAPDGKTAMGRWYGFGANALPAGDGTTSLVALDAEVEIVHNGERKWLPIRDIYLGPGKSLLDSTKDILLQFRFDLCKAGESTAFSRIMRPQGVALPILGCAVWVKLDASGENIDEARISMAPVAPTPQRIAEAENALKAGKSKTH